MSDVPICVKGGGGIVFPIAGDDEQDWPRGLRIALYFIGLVWCFMGVALISDVFMGAIEKVTSRKARLFNKRTQRFYTFEVWNATVANLTLMALGSSAPEILLNVIDIFAKEFYLEGLGPSTIVGSAAFNLLMIIAVCIVAIPDGQVRYIKDLTVYMCTATWSIFAYLWLIIILVFFSPHVVEIWEGVLTFLFFPLLTFHAFACDKGWLGGAMADSTGAFSVHRDMSPEELAEAEAAVRKQHGQNLTDEQVGRILAATGPRVSARAAKYRVGVTRSIFGGKKQKVVRLARSLTRTQSTPSRKIVPIESEEPPCPVSTFEFLVAKLAVLESAGSIVLKVGRTGDFTFPARVYYKTKDGTALQGTDYVAAEGWLEFKEGQTEAMIEVAIIDDDGYTGDAAFYVELSEPKVETGLIAALGREYQATITIIDDEAAGILTFDQDTLIVEQQRKDFDLPVKVTRKRGTTGVVKVKFTTEGDTAIAGRDFEDSKGELAFEYGQQEATFHITIKNISRYYASDRFRVVLSEPSGGAKLDDTMDGGAEVNILTVIINPDEGTSQANVHSLIAKTWDKSKLSHANWASQFVSALYIDGADDDDDESEPAPHSVLDWALHIVAVPWKLLFALVPPTDYCGGWVCFFFSLAMIGLVTMFISDLASLLGCVMCIPDDITAITLVALGTSLPDTFASKTAATQDPHADASVGNVTGSNSVNVFLGLGLPWMIASIAWAVKGRDEKWDALFQHDPDLSWLGPPGAREIGFVVKAGSLSFSVAVFTACASVCIVLLAVRRRLAGGELGGPKLLKWMSAGLLTFMWLLYIALSSFQSLSASGGARCSG